MMTIRKFYLIPAALMFFLCAASRSLAAAAPQSPPTQVLTLEEAVNYALTHYPAVQASRERVEAARGGVTFAHTNYLPRLDSLYQANRATANNAVGVLVPQAVVPGREGPVQPYSPDTAWGSDGGLLFTWQPYAFGYRRAEVEAARASVNLASANVALTRLSVAANAMNGFFNLLAAEQAVTVAQADVRRWQVVNKSVHDLVDHELRPGADASRADAQLAQAEIQLIQAQQQVDVNRAALADALGLDTSAVEVSPGPLLGLPPQSALPAPPPSSHPAAVVQQNTLRQAEAQVDVLHRAYYPSIYLQSFIAGVGSGFTSTGGALGGTNGLGFTTGNYGAAVTVNFPILSVFGIHAQERTAKADVRSDTNSYQQTLLGINDQVAQAQAMLKGAQGVADKTPIELQAARTGEIQSRTQYQTGLATIVELADAESLLEQAEINDALARLAVWRNLGNLAAAQGDLAPFFEIVRTGGH